MSEMNQAKNSSQQSLPHLIHLPILEIVQNLHNHNLKVAKVCRQHSLNLLQNYHHNKTQYQQLKEPQINEKIKTAAQISKNKKKTIENKQKDMKKKNNENIAKLEHMLDQKRIQLEKKQARMMQQSQIRRLQFLKTLRSSHIVSQDKRYHIKQREKKELQDSLILQKENSQKVQAALERRESFLNDIKWELQRKNEESGTVLQQCREDQKLRKSQLLKKIAEKEEIVHKSLEEKINEAQKKLQQKKKENQKKKEKLLKKKSQIIEDKQIKIQKQEEKVQAKLTKAYATRQASLKSISNHRQTKRQLRQKQQFYTSIYRAKEQEDKITELSQKLYSSHQFFYNAKELKQKLQHNNLYDYIKVKQELLKDEK